ncbi:MAG: transcription elongation factor GreA [Elusimicrobiota bacterium]
MSDYLTKEGIKKLNEELEKLRAEKAELNKEIEDARSQGDLKENAGYQYAKEKQNLVIKRISEIESRIKNSKIVDGLEINKEEVRIGATVKLYEHLSKKEITYKLVSSDEADPASGKISVSTPIAQGILGLKKGEKKKVVLPNGITKEFEILSIDY